VAILIEDKSLITFAEQSDIFIHHLRTRKRNPLKESSLAVYKSYSANWIAPLIGDKPLAEFTPVAMRDFVAKLSVSLGPKSVNEVVSLTKSIVGSVRDEQGVQVFRTSFDSEFIDLPVVKHADQKTPIFSANQIENMISDSNATYRCLYALAASSGLRISELLSIRTKDDGVSTVFDPSGRIHVRQTLWRGKPQAPKTSAATRTVEILRPVAEMLRAFIGNRIGYVFGNGNGRPIDVSSARDQLEKQVGSGCFHAFRRFRTTTLRKAHCNEAVLRFWLGHAGIKSISDIYDRTAFDESFRREECDRIGLGFELPR